jgi:hypothetical protein
MFKLTKSEDRNSPAVLVALERELGLELQRKQTELADAQATAGSDVIEGALKEGSIRALSSTAARKAVQLQAEVESIRAAIDVSRQRRREAIRARQHTEAREQRQRAAEFRQQADVIDRKFAKVVGEAAEIQDIRLNAEVLEATFETRSARLRREAAGLESNATVLESREPKADGTIEAAGLGELIDLLFADPECIAPSAQAVTEWALQVESQIRKGEPTYMLEQEPPQPRKYRLVFTAAGIDDESSVVTFGGPNYAHDYTTARGRVGRMRQGA